MTGPSGWSSGVQIGAEAATQSGFGVDGSVQLQIELLEGTSGGCLARMSGHLVGGTAAALWSVESMMANEARVVLDLSGVVAIDSAGLEATIRFVDAIRSFGGSLTIGSDDSQVVSVLPRT